MQADPSGPGADVSAPDTTASPSVAPDTGPTPEGLLAVERPSDDTDATDQPTPDDESAEDDGADEGEHPDQPDQTEEQKKLSRRERQRQREEERIAKAVQERFEQAERERQTAEQQAKVEQARAERQKALAAYRGEEGEHARLTAEIADLNRQIRSELSNPQGIDLDAVEQQIAQKEARLGSITQAQAFEGEIAQGIWNGIEAAMLSPLQWPELSGPELRQKYLSAEGGIVGCLQIAREAIVAAKDAEKASALKAQADQHATALKALEADRNAWRVRAGGAEAADTSSGGTAANGSGLIYTRERLRQMMQTPAGMAEYRRNKAEIERQERAGLIR